MELQTIASNAFHSDQALTNQGAEPSLSPAASSYADKLSSAGNNLASVVESATSKVNPSSAVTQLVIGKQAAVEVYEQSVDSKSVNSSQSTVDVIKKNITSERAIESQIDQIEHQVTQELAARDREVRAHEQTHASVGGAFASAPRYEFTSGPDGQVYATSGEVSIDTSAVANDPQATLEKAKIVIRAALSVTAPSSADLKVAAEAKSMAIEALSEIREGDAKIIGEEQSQDFRQMRLQLEHQQIELAEYREEVELKKAKQERIVALADASHQSSEKSFEVMKEYNAKINDIKDTLRQLNAQLVDSGIFDISSSESVLIDQNV